MVLQRSILLFVLFCRQIETDSMFLEEQHIMDYSLLLGVHYRAPQQLRPPASYNHSTSLDGLARLAEEGGYQIQSRKCLSIIWSIIIFQVSAIIYILAFSSNTISWNSLILKILVINYRPSRG